MIEFSLSVAKIQSDSFTFICKMQPCHFVNLTNALFMYMDTFSFVMMALQPNRQLSIIVKHLRLQSD